MDPDAPWLLDEDNKSTSETDDKNASVVLSNSSEENIMGNIPAGPPVPNPYAHIVSNFNNIRYN